MTRIISIIATSALLLSVHTSAAEEQDRTELGLLECTIEGGFGLLLGSSKDANCEFAHKDGTTETYSGKLKKLGLDVGVTGRAVQR